MIATEPPDPRKSQVVLIGVSVHDDPGLPSYAALETGVNELAQLLQSDDIWGVPASQCHTLTGSDATQQRVSEVLIEAAEAAEDALLVYYGGHGILDRTGTSTKLLLAQKEASHRHTLNWMDFDLIRRHLQHGTPMARHRVLLLDSCHSGEAMNRGVLNAAAGDSWDDDDRSNLSTLITSCEKLERAAIPVTERYSAFMAALIDMLATGIDGVGSALTSEDLHNGLKSRIGGVQTPRLLCADGAGALPLFKNRQHSTAQLGPNATSQKTTIPLPPKYVVGRDADIKSLLVGARSAAAGKGPFIAVVHGRGGAGKSAIVQQAAAEVNADFPEWQFYLNLHTWTPGQLARSPANLLEELLYQARQTNIPPDLATRADRWRDWLAEHRALIVLDDVADAAQVQEVLPPVNSRCAMLLTSRNSLANLSSDTSIEAGPLSEGDSVALLRRGTSEPLGDDDLAALAESVGRIPKALDVLRQQLRNVHPDLLQQRIKSAGSHALDVIYRDALQQLEPDLCRTVYACGFHPGPDFDAASIGAITGAAEDATAEHLHALVEHRLIKPLPHYRFQLHDEDTKIVPVIAAEADPDGYERSQIRLISWIRRRVNAAMKETWGSSGPSKLGEAAAEFAFTGPGTANKWLNEAGAEVLAGTLMAVQMRHAEAIGLAEQFAAWLRLTDRYDLSTAVLVRLSDNAGPEGQTKSAYGLGQAAQLQGQWQEAEDHYQKALDIADGTNAPNDRANARFGLGWVALLRGNWSESEVHYLAALDFAVSAGNLAVQASVLNGLGTLARLQNRHDEAEGHYHAALGLARTSGDLVNQSTALCRIGTIARLQGRAVESEQSFLAALNLARTTGDRPGQATALSGLGGSARLQDRWAEGEAHYRAALNIARSTGDRIAEAIAIRGLGSMARSQGNWTEAEQQYRAAFDFAEASDDRVGRAMALEGLGWTHKGALQKLAARTAFKEARDLYQDLNLTDWANQCDRAQLDL